jgi:hypothetical protein
MKIFFKRPISADRPGFLISVLLFGHCSRQASRMPTSALARKTTQPHRDIGGKLRFDLIRSTAHQLLKLYGKRTGLPIYYSSKIAACGPMEFLLDRGRKIVQVIEKSDNLPDLTIGHDIPPRWHGRSAHPVLDEVELLVLGQAGMRLHELRRSWREGCPVITHRIIRPAVAVGTLVAIQAGAIEQVGRGSRDRIPLRWGVAGG